MKLKFLNSESNKESTQILIGKTGQLRFKTDLAKSLDFIKNEFWQLAIDEEETPVKHIYLLREYPNKKLKIGNKMRCLNGRWSMEGNILIKELNIDLPIKCKFEQFSELGFKGLRLTIQ